MNKGMITGLIALGLLVAAIAFFAMRGDGNTQPTSTPKEQLQMDADDEAVEDSEEEDATDEEVTEVVVEGKNFSFSPSTLAFSPGEKVKLTFKSVGGTHDFTVEGLDIATEMVNTGQEVVVEFTAPTEPGEYTFYCSVANHRSLGMEGVMIVE